MHGRSPACWGNGCPPGSSGIPPILAGVWSWGVAFLTVIPWHAIHAPASGALVMAIHGPGGGGMHQKTPEVCNTRPRVTSTRVGDCKIQTGSPRSCEHHSYQVALDLPLELTAIELPR